MKSMLWRINWFGLAGGVVTVLVVVVSMFYPWWQLKGGEGLVTVNASPLNTNFNVLGTAFTVPLLWAANVTCILTLVASSVTMIIYSIFPAKSYSKHLLGFAYKKPLFVLLSFVMVIFVLALLAQNILHFNVPLSGSVNSTLPIPLVQGTTVSVLISTGFQLPFWLAIIAASLCIVARIYHRKVATTPVSSAVSASQPVKTAQ